MYRYFWKRRIFSLYLKKIEKSASYFVTTSCWEILWFKCLYFPEIIFFPRTLIVWKPHTWPVKITAKRKFVRTNSHLGRTLSGDRPLFWALRSFLAYMLREINIIILLFSERNQHPWGRALTRNNTNCFNAKLTVFLRLRDAWNQQFAVF